MNIENIQITEEYRLYQNYPNPFNPQTKIMYYLPNNSEISLTIYNAIGKEIRSLVKGKKKFGYHTVVWDSKDNYGNKVSAGIYLYQLRSQGYIKNNKMVLIK